MYIITYVVTFICYVCYNPYVHRDLPRISFAELTSCLNITITITIQLAFLMVLEQNHKYTAHTYIASHLSAIRLSEQVTLGN